MRVHLGCDHAGLDLKEHLTAWLSEHGYEPVDHGPFWYDAEDDYPVFCLRAATAVAEEGAAGLDSLGVVIGGSGHGEQIAANVVAFGGRMPSLEDMTRFVELFLAEPFSGAERHQRRIDQLTAYEGSGAL